VLWFFHHALAYGAVEIINGHFDTGIVYEETLKIKEKYFRESKDQIQYFVKFETHDSNEVEIPQIKFDKIKPNESFAKLKLKPGYLGYRWIVDSDIEILD